MTSGVLGAPIRQRRDDCGLSRDFYGASRESMVGARPVRFNFEPRVAEESVTKCSRQNMFRTNHPPRQVSKPGTDQSSRGTDVYPANFIDATYEGALLANGGVTFTVARISATYN